MDLQTSSGPMAADWAGLSPQKRDWVASFFLVIREAFPATRERDCGGLWDSAVEWARHNPVELPGGEGTIVARVTRSSSDPEGLAFIDRMNGIASEAEGGAR
jgi:hypothetical protein